MRICFISHMGSLGGAQNILLETIEVCQEQGIECRVILPQRGEFSERLKGLGIPFAILPVPWWASLRDLPLRSRIWLAGSILKAVGLSLLQVRRWKCDVIYSSTITVCTGAFVAALLRLPHIWHIQEFGREDHGLNFNFGEDASVKLLGRLSASVIGLSSALKSKFEAYIEPSKIAVIYPSMHLAIQENQEPIDGAARPNPKTFRCAIVGRLVQGKRQEDAILAVSRLAELGMVAELVIVGPGDRDYRERLEAIAAQKGLLRSVSFVGEVSSALPLIAAADVLLMCSRSEAFGRVTIEAMLAGKPVIGARSGATPELIQDGVTGLLYSVGDPFDLAEKIRSLAEDHEYCERLGRNARCWAASVFTKQRYFAEMQPVLNSLRIGQKSQVKRTLSADEHSPTYN